MLRLIVFSLLGPLGLVMNGWLTPRAAGGSGWIGSPLAVVASRAIYGKSQVPWHNGVDETVLTSFRALEQNRFTWYFDRIYELSKPDPNLISHRQQSSMEDLAKDCETIRLMELAARWDPLNYRARYDLGFMLRARAHRPDLALAVLDEGLSHPVPPGGQLELMTSKFELLFIDQRRKADALEMVTSIDRLSAYCRSHPQPVDGTDLASLLLKARLIDLICDREVISF